MQLTSEQLRKLKQIEAEMLRAFVDVCETLNLRYYLVEGSLLGAVRHQGFIPWDDDIDVAMPREDYEVFLEKGQAFLPEHLFVQSIYSDPEYLMCFAKIRNSNTTFVESSVSHLKINHGVYIDIFPLDYYPEEKAGQRRLARKKRLYERRINMMFNLSNNEPLKTRIISLIMKLLYPSVKKVIQKREKLYKSVKSGTMVTNHGSAWGQKEVVPVDWFGKGTPVMFEGAEVAAPDQYHNWLTQIYGDYMQLPPEEKRVGHHYVDAIDLNRPFAEHLKQKQ